MLVSCGVNDKEWVTLQTDQDYDLVRYDPDRGHVWATNNYEDYIVKVAVDMDGNPLDSMSVIDLPMNTAALGLCVSDSVWVLTGSSAIRYLEDIEQWDTQFHLDLDTINSCKDYKNKSVLFIGSKKQTEYVVKYESSKSISYVQLLPGWRDVTQDDRGDLWLAMDNAIYLRDLQSQNWKLWSDTMGADAIFFTQDKIWTVKNGHIFYSTINSQFSPTEVVGINFNLNPAVYQGDDGQIWIVSQTGIWKFLKEHIEPLPLPKRVKHINIRNDFDSRNNILFISTEDGVYSVKLGE